MKLLKFKRESTEIMEEGGFQLHRWHSNVPGIEEHKPSGDGSGSSQEPDLCKVSSLNPVPWDKDLGSSMEQGRRQAVYQLHSMSGKRWEGSVNKEEDAVGYQSHLWPVRNCCTGGHLRKDTVQWSVLEETKVGWRSTRRHTEAVEQVVERYGRVPIYEYSPQHCKQRPSWSSMDLQMQVS